MNTMLDKATEVAAQLKLISNPYRLAILCQLADKPYNVTELTALVGISQTSMSNHLAKLRQAGIVDFTRTHRELTYFVSDERMHTILKHLHQLYCHEGTKNE